MASGAGAAAAGAGAAASAVGTGIGSAVTGVGQGIASSLPAVSTGAGQLAQAAGPTGATTIRSLRRKPGNGLFIHCKALTTHMVVMIREHKKAAKNADLLRISF